MFLGDKFKKTFKISLISTENIKKTVNDNLLPSLKLNPNIIKQKLIILVEVESHQPTNFFQKKFDFSPFIKSPILFIFFNYLTN